MRSCVVASPVLVLAAFAVAASVGCVSTSDAANAPRIASVTQGLAICEGTAVDFARSLFVTDDEALAPFSFSRVMTTLLERGNAGSQTPLSLYQQWWATNSARTSTNRLGCGATLNRFPHQCPRQEEGLAQTDPFTDETAANPDSYIPVGLVNRLDLAPIGGENCGEYRIVFAKRSGLTDTRDRNLVILESVLPNPAPQSGLEGCRPVAEFWAGLSEDPSAASRASKLDAFYFDGLTGFEPVFHPDHLGRVGGQIRTNQFMNNVVRQPWQLREYKVERRCGATGCALNIRNVTVKGNPHPDNFGTAGNSTFQTTDFIDQVPALAATSLTSLGMTTLDVYNGGESTEQGTTANDYVVAATDTSPIRANIQASLSALGSALTVDNVLDRATSQSCAGCHQVSNGRSLGGGLVWPRSNQFTHVDEQKRLSPALTETFLPARATTLQSFVCSSGATAQAATSVSTAQVAPSGTTLGGRARVH